MTKATVSHSRTCRSTDAPTPPATATSSSPPTHQALATAAGFRTKKPAPYGREVIANNKAWRAAETVRREWLKSFVARKNAPKGALRFIFSELAEGDRQLRDAIEKNITASLASCSASPTSKRYRSRSTAPATHGHR
jgi:hypothetical protein